MSLFNLKKYFASKFPNWDVVEDINIKWDCGKTMMIVRVTEGGEKYEDGTKIEPIQMMVYTNNLEESKLLLEKFVEENTQKYIRRDSLDIIPTYFPPVVLQEINEDGSAYYYTLMSTGILQISSNIDDIKEVWIDEVKYPTTNRVLSYNALADTQNDNVNVTYCKSIMRVSQTQFSATLVSKANRLRNKLRSLRSHDLGPDVDFTIKLVYTDNFEETYTMKCLNHTMSSENGQMPSLQISFGE